MRVYFAHPCFTGEQERFKREFVRKLTAALARGEYGGRIAIMDPFLYTPNVEHDIKTKLSMSKTIKASCIGLLEDCDLVLALTDGNDTGTAFEAGYAHCLNMPVILISGDTCDTANAMLIGAARERFDRVLEDAQMEMLAHMLEWFFVSKSGFPSAPAGN
jgi:nucleoside 2-deoxyribosyltransferase